MRICPSRASFVTQTMSPSPSKRGVNAVPSSNSFIMVWIEAGAAASFAAAQQCQETDLLGGIVAKDAGKLRGDGFGAILANAAHRHAQMLRLKHNGTAARAEMTIDRADNLRGQCLLRLQPLGIDIDESCKFGKSRDA